MKEIVSQPTNGVICEDGKIAKNGLRVICPFCGEIGLSQGRGGSVNVWTVGAIERRECTKCRKQFHTIWSKPAFNSAGGWLKCLSSKTCAA